VSSEQLEFLRVSVTKPSSKELVRSCSDDFLAIEIIHMRKEKRLLTATSDIHRSFSLINEWNTYYFVRYESQQQNLEDFHNHYGYCEQQPRKNNSCLVQFYLSSVWIHNRNKTLSSSHFPVPKVDSGYCHVVHVIYSMISKYPLNMRWLSIHQGLRVLKGY
jgi:hypothetical protein